MKQAFQGWASVARELGDRAKAEAEKESQYGEVRAYLNEGQRASLKALAQRLPNNGVVIADEVGMGKTRIAVTLAHSVIKAGGRVAIIVPPGLGYQWQTELQEYPEHQEGAPPLLRSLGTYLEAWSSHTQNEPWFKNNVVLVSHRFTNWNLGEDSVPWRWALLPEFYARWRKKVGKQLPRCYHKASEQTLYDARVKEAAQSIASAITPEDDHFAYQTANRLMEEIRWPAPLNPAEYRRGGELREWLERIVGMGLGVFDLVIIDEAHKSRNDYSGLSRLLGHVIQTTPLARRLGMTATPVELNISQWTSTLARVGIDNRQLKDLEQPIEHYARSIRRVRRAWMVSDEARTEFKRSAAKFEECLSPYLLRRDKREDPAVKKFASYPDLQAEAYRNLGNDIRIDTSSLSNGWKQTVCAAEALSLAAKRAEDSLAQRLRLTLGNGHGIAAVVDQARHKSPNDQSLDEDETESEDGQQGPETLEMSARTKRHERIEWWKGVIAAGIPTEADALLEHPAILAAVEAIEGETGKGEKVLVFGRFTKPLQALVRLLNAREMLRRLHFGNPWPQAKVSGKSDGHIDSSEWPAVRAAHKQLGATLNLEPLDEESLNKKLEDQYKRFDLRRGRFRDQLIELLTTGLSSTASSIKGKERDQVRAVIDTIRQSDRSDDVVIIARALSHLLLHTEDDGGQLPHPNDVFDAFSKLMLSATDRDDPDVDENKNGKIDEDEAFNLWERLKERLRIEYIRPEGGFARLMNGQTPHSSRRLLQLAFNRKDSFPRVLVAQSMVGREGLNLHEACRIVVILHPEWNPGVVEQQIGRVDRVGSRWCQEIYQAIEDGVPSQELPRIEVRQVIFEGTYDEYNWRVLRQRWDDLRAQLYGVVIPHHEFGEWPNLAEEVNPPLSG